MFPFPLWEEFFSLSLSPTLTTQRIQSHMEDEKVLQTNQTFVLELCWIFLRQRPSVRSQYGRVPGIALRGVNSWPSLVALWCGGTEKVPSHIPSIPRPGQSLLLRAIGPPQIDAVDAGRAWPQDGDKRTTRSCSSRSRAKSMG